MGNRQDLLNEIKNMFDCMEKVGLDAAGYKSRFSSIEEDEGYIDRLQCLLSEMKGVYEIFNSARKLDVCSRFVSISSELLNLEYQDVSKEELKLIVDKVCESLEFVIHNRVYLESQFDDALKKVYQVVYGVMKREFTVSNDSKIYVKCKKSEEISKFMNVLVKCDIDKLSSQGRGVYQFLLELGLIGINVNCFDSDIIRTVVKFENASLNKSSAIQLSSMARDNANNYLIIKELYKNFQKKVKKVTDYKKNNTYSKEISKKLKALGLTAGIMVGGVVLIGSGAKKLFGYKVYNKQVSTYSVKDGFNTWEEEVKVSENERDHTYVTEYKPWVEKGFWIFGNYEREVNVYDVGYLNYSNLQDYMYVPLSNDHLIDSNVDAKSKSNYGRLDEYISSYREVMRVDVGTDAYDSYGTLCEAFIVIGRIIYLFLFVMAEIGLKDSDYGVYNLLRNYLKLKSLKDADGAYKELVDDLMKDADELLNLINSSDEVRNRFNELFNSNAFLVDDYVSLWDQINDVREIVSIKNGVSSAKKKFGR